MLHIKFPSHINSQYHQNGKDPSQLLWLISRSFSVSVKIHLDGSAELHGSPANAHISPKTLYPCVKTKFPSHMNSQCPQNTLSLWHRASTASQNV